MPTLTQSQTATLDVSLKSEIPKLSSNGTHSDASLVWTGVRGSVDIFCPFSSFSDSKPVSGLFIDLDTPSVERESSIKFRLLHGEVS